MGVGLPSFLPLLHLLNELGVKFINLRTHYLTIIVIFFFVSSFGQDIDHPIKNNLHFNELKGEWYLTTIDSNLTFMRYESGMGQLIKILDNGEFVRSYFPMCGNDSGASTENGKWQVNERMQIFETTISITKYGNKFIIIKLTQDEFVLRELK